LASLLDFGKRLLHETMTYGPATMPGWHAHFLNYELQFNQQLEKCQAKES
jgi:hypothetical protein